MLNIAEGKDVSKYTKDAVKLTNIDDNIFNKYNKGALSKWQKDMKDKIKKQFIEFNLKPEDIEGHIFSSNSEPVKRIKESQDFKNILIKNKEAILNREEKFSGSFVPHKKFRSSNLYYAYGTVDFYNGGIDNNGNLHLYMFDTYEFNKKGDNSIESPLIQAGRRQMMMGELKGHFSLHEIVVSKEELDKIWRD